MIDVLSEDAHGTSGGVSFLWLSGAFGYGCNAEAIPNTRTDPFPLRPVLN